MKLILSFAFLALAAVAMVIVVVKFVSLVNTL